MNAQQWKKVSKSIVKRLIMSYSEQREKKCLR
nr:MAG TPA: hypothetical protein [Caudoviricetes sp.]